MEKRDSLDVSIEQALGSMSDLEATLGKLDKVNLRTLVEMIPQLELDVRMTRLRLQAFQDMRHSPNPQQSDPDKTPVEPVRIRRQSSQSLRIPLPKPEPEKKD